MVATLLVFVLSALTGSESARILAAVPFPSISHQTPFRLIALELARRGHQVTLITTDPIKRTVANYTEIDISPAYRYLRSSFDTKAMEMALQDWDPVEMLHTMEDISFPICEDGLKSPDLQSFIKSAPKFDVYILERLLTPCFYGLAYKVGSPPIVAFVSLGAYSHSYTASGNPTNPAYLPDWILPYSDHMSFWERLSNTYLWLRLHHSWFNVVLPRHDEIQRKYIDPDVPSIFDVERNFSLMLLNNHFSMSYPRPLLPNIIELTGLHIDGNIKPLPKDVQEWMDGAVKGVVYFSLGTNVKTSAMPAHKLSAFVEAFAQLEQRVLWKLVTDSPLEVPPNVKVATWLPQQAILAHPNIRVFITQGGLQSLNEATYHGVPLIGIPFHGDQHQNVGKIVSAEIGQRLLFKDVAKDTVLRAVRSLIEDPRYRDNMKRLSPVYREHQAESLPRAVWWIEYLIRHQGAPHLRSAALDLTWYQLLLLDVVAFVLAATVVSGYALYVLARVLFSSLCKDRKLKKL